MTENDAHALSRLNAPAEPKYLTACVQAAPVAFDLQRTLEKTRDLSADAARHGAKLVLFPEAFVSAYPRGASFGATIGARTAEGRVRDCHGDLHSGNIFVTDKICIFDAIEFNDRFRYSDVAADVAFLAMDLDYQKRSDLADYFITQYVAYSKDAQLKQMLPFYKCYRAYVRGKVVSFRLDDPHIKAEEKSAAINEAKGYFQLATQYAKSL